MRVCLMCNSNSLPVKLLLSSNRDLVLLLGLQHVCTVLPDSLILLPHLLSTDSWTDKAVWPMIIIVMIIYRISGQGCLLQPAKQSSSWPKRLYHYSSCFYCCYYYLQDFRPRMPSAARQAEQQLAKASSVTSLAPKPKGKAAKGTKGKAAAAKGRKGGTPKKGNRVVWDSVPQKRRSGDRAGGPSAGRQFASAARLHQVGFYPGVSLRSVERS